MLLFWLRRPRFLFIPVLSHFLRVCNAFEIGCGLFGVKSLEKSIRMARIEKAVAEQRDLNYDGSRESSITDLASV